MHQYRRTIASTGLVLALLFTASCAKDDGAATRNCGSGSGSGSAAADSGSGAASGSGAGASSGCASSDSGSGSDTGSSEAGSGTGLSSDDLGKTSDDPLVEEAVTQYKAYVATQVDELVTTTKTFTDAVRSGDVEAAKAAFAPSRQAWERIEPIAGLVEGTDGAVDSRVDDFTGPDDPEFTGWHRLEYLLWEKNTTDGGKEFADQLDEDLAKLKTQVPELKISALIMAKGAADLIEEVSEGKISGEEDRYSHTDLWDFAANVEGSQKVFELLKPALEKKDPELAKTITEQFAAVTAILAPYKDGTGYKSYEDLSEADKDKAKAALAALSESLAKVPGALGLS